MASGRREEISNTSCSLCQLEFREPLFARPRRSKRPIARRQAAIASRALKLGLSGQIWAKRIIRCISAMTMAINRFRSGVNVFRGSVSFAGTQDQRSALSEDPYMRFALCYALYAAKHCTQPFPGALLDKALRISRHVVCYVGLILNRVFEFISAFQVRTISHSGL